MKCNQNIVDSFFILSANDNRSKIFWPFQFNSNVVWTSNWTFAIFYLCFQIAIVVQFESNAIFWNWKQTQHRNIVNNAFLYSSFLEYRKYWKKLRKPCYFFPTRQFTLAFELLSTFTSLSWHYFSSYLSTVLFLLHLCKKFGHTKT